MFRPASRSVLRSATRTATFTSARTVGGRRFLSTDPPHLRSRSWKNGALRWGIAAAGLYYYTTSPVFAEQPQHNLLNPNVQAIDTDDSPTLEALTASSRRKSEKQSSVLQSAIETASADDAFNNTAQPAGEIPGAAGSPADLEEEAGSQGAFNPETGEINWDCPCLGGMAHGPCGPEFKEAFSCFVYSTEEPKGMNCIDKFQNMQNCFRAHPEHYKAELEDDEELDAELAQERDELQTQIAERKAAEKKSTEGESASRSSDGAAATPAPAPKKKASKSKKSSEDKPSKSAKSAESLSKVSASSEPHPGMSEEHELLNEGQRSPTNSEPAPQKSVEAHSFVEDKLVPKAAHDARSS